MTNPIPAPDLSPSEVATVTRFGIHEPQWVVHHMGPDDIYPATDMLDAIKQAHAINAAAVENGGYYDVEEMRPFMTYGWAVPVLESEVS